MGYSVKYATYDDLNECVAVEKETMGNYTYLEDAWHYFHQVKGELVCVYDQDKMVGIGKFTVLSDGTGWLETLRVIPSYQNKGVGKLIYIEYLKLAKQYNCPSIAMFTGTGNKASAGLAKLNGLSLVSEHTGYSLTNLTNGNSHNFKHIDCNSSVDLILSLKDEYNDYMTSNRTFYHINELNIKNFAIEGKVFADDNSVIVCGARFQHNSTLHIPLIGGDYEKCLDFAVNYAKAQGLNKITCTFARENTKLEQALQHRGFEKEPSNLITLERKF